MRTINFYLLRHGKVQGEPALYGRTDVAVDASTQQAICNAIMQHNLPIEYIVTSPLKRCSDLAALIKSAEPQLPVMQNAQLQEIDFGLYDGIPFTELNSHWQELELFWQHPASSPLPQSEPLHEFYHRVTSAWCELVKESQGDTLIVCHGGTIRMILAYVLGLDWANAKLFSVLQIGNQSLTHIKMTISDAVYPQVCSIGIPLNTAKEKV